MSLTNDTAGTRRRTLRGLGLAALLGSSLLAASHAPAEGFDAGKGRRLLSAALASSAVEQTLGREISTPRTPEQLLLMFLINPRYNAYMLKQPQVLPNLLDRVSEPGFLVAMYQAALTPEAYLHFLSGWTDVEKMRSYFEVLDPAVILAWAGALSDPGFYGAIQAALAEPRKMQAWLTFLMGNRIEELIAPPLNPQTPLAWLTLPFNPGLLRYLEGPLHLLQPSHWFTIAGTLMASGQQAVARFSAPRDSLAADDTRLASAHIPLPDRAGPP